jgi:hypothetical protein
VSFIDTYIVNPCVDGFKNTQKTDNLAGTVIEQNNEKSLPPDDIGRQG